MMKIGESHSLTASQYTVVRRPLELQYCKELTNAGRGNDKNGRGDLLLVVQRPRTLEAKLRWGKTLSPLSKDHISVATTPTLDTSSESACICVYLL